ncbi:VOC family protein [Shimwellia blattae]|uniref:Putative Glyoxalase/bleomycin resistance protein/dioxygenase n=1 Tax=Shimwellia blattae (strain ATCC 29907 / DSM 4481 / JCM 1650 / NBRC 105725 / CDC 9005-74) TaxID=630626 RepID=I2BDA1_SHIBC|nr:VOC family protein [Shimwellia blattae]AFJ48505.1 putative Glyoxalase/bleomycin resistance protein/dioxygenase [Shimwellia blattae DSM 4481 = NBRC 105725]GAB83099.1 hypothetical protein EB105725_44_00090 [Shimwellia blattae DSM 4481 = NBRC 105725]VDY65997.1 Uncharacterized protein conserved in bacteria [Shimwellia blattae]VEC26581.1 Uncharacterized protein conserved in bacteria [Shimwellia blattae]
MQVQPYLFYPGNCAEALAFYEKSAGATVSVMMRYREAPEKIPVPPGWEEKIMHANITLGDTQFMAADGPCDTPHPGFHGFGMALSVQDKAQAEQLFTALSAGGEITMPFQPTFWSPGFGMLKDRFGVMWMVVSEQPPA